MNRPKRADVVTLRARLDAGEELLVGEVGALFGKDRWQVDDWIKAGRIRYRRTPGRQRLCNPEDVRSMLADFEQVRRDTDEKTDTARPDSVNE